MPVIFFDIGDTLASPTIADGTLDFTVLPGVLTALEGLSKRARLSIISNRGNLEPETVTRALDTCGLLRFFEPNLIVFAKKDSSAPFLKGAALAHVPPGDCIFVGENNKERAHALSAGFRKAIPDPALALDVLNGAALVFVSLSPPDTNGNDIWLKAFTDPALLPLRIANNPRRVDVLTTTSATARLRHLGFESEVLGKEDTPQVADLYLIRDDRPVPAGFVSAADFSVDFLSTAGRRDLAVGTTDSGLLVALPPGVSIEELHFPEALHGHNEKLIPDRSLLASLRTNISAIGSAISPAAFATVLGAEELEALRGITGESLRHLHERYIGDAPLTSSSGPIVSRHIKHADNSRATAALLDHLKELGGAEIIVRRHPFKQQSLRLDNIEAEFVGEMPNSFVLITAHLDSTASSSLGGLFNPTSDPAPGSDDDASGIAAVLAAASAIARLRTFKKTRRSIRFVLFNAEEQGLVGSKSYAAAQAAQQVDIAAVFQMDMIGFRRQEAQPARNFEVHAGFAVAPDVEARSLVLAQLVREVVPQVSPNLDTPQVYPDVPGAPDPAADRSDHAAFQQRGYAACVLCEDFFVGPKPDSPNAQPNPNYHKNTDKQIDYEYAADIARVVTAAALQAANARIGVPSF